MKGDINSMDTKKLVGDVNMVCLVSYRQHDWIPQKFYPQQAPKTNKRSPYLTKMVVLCLLILINAKQSCP